jgi:MFS family permease
VLKHRDFRLIWGAELLSNTGNQIQRVAVAWQVFELTHDPLQLGLLGLVRFFPLFFFGLIGGMVADRYDRRTTIIVVQLAQMLVAAAFAGLTASGRITIPLIYGLTAVGATLAAVSTPTRHALIPTLVPKASMPAAMTMGVLAMQSAGMAGPALGGALIAAFGVPMSYAVDAATFGLIALAAAALHTRPEQTVPTISGRAAIVEGLRFLRETPVLLAAMTLDFLATFFGATTTLMPIFAADLLGGGPQTLGLLLSAPAAGAVTGAAVMAGRRPLARPGAGIIGAIAIYGIALIGFAFSRNMALSLTLLAISGAADAVSVTQRHTLRNMVTPDRLRGRVAAAHATFAGGGPQLGEFQAGVVATVIGAPLAVAAGGVCTLIAALIVGQRVPAIRNLQWDLQTRAIRIEQSPREPKIGCKDIDERGHGSI